MTDLTGNTPARDLRAQIDAVKVHLCSEGLGDVEEPLVQVEAAEGFHTITAAFAGKLRRLRLSYQWLSDHTPNSAVAWILDKQICDRLKQSDTEATIHDRGSISGR